MALGQRPAAQQEEMWIATGKLRSPGHPFYERLNRLLAQHRFDAFAAAACARFYAATLGRAGTPPGVYFRCLLSGYFEGIDSERGIAWRAADSMSLRTFLGGGPAAVPPDDSTISRTRQLIDLETHQQVFDFALRRRVHVSAFNLGLIMRRLCGFGTPRGLQGLRAALSPLAAAVLKRLHGFLVALDALCRVDALLHWLVHRSTRRQAA